MLRIAHVISTSREIGGAEWVLEALLEGGSRAGWDQIVLNPFAAPEARLRPVVESKGAAFESRGGSRVVNLPSLRTWLRHRLDAFAPDVVHAHLFHALVLTSSVSRKHEKARVLTHHHGDFLRVHKRGLEERIDRIAGKRFDVVVAVSDAVRNFLVDDYGYPTSKVVTIRNGWSRPVLGSVAAKAPNPTIVSTANLRVEKGHVVLIDAFELVRRQVPEARLVLVGDGPERPGLEARVATLGLSNLVEFAGSVPNVWTHLQRAHVFCLSSLSEPLGIAVMEAMGAGLPVVASRVGGIPELVAHGVTGYLVEAGDARGLAGRLVELLLAPDAATMMGEAGRDLSEGWKMERTVREYADLYERVIAGGEHD